MEAMRQARLYRLAKRLPRYGALWARYGLRRGLSILLTRRGRVHQEPTPQPRRQRSRQHASGRFAHRDSAGGASLSYELAVNSGIATADRLRCRRRPLFRACRSYFALADPTLIRSADSLADIGREARAYFDVDAFAEGDIFFEPDSSCTEPLNRGPLFRRLKAKGVIVVVLNRDGGYRRGTPVTKADDIGLAEAPYGSELYAQTLQLRDAILRKPLGLNLSQEELADDIRRRHFAPSPMGR
jgi:hypothetical protein